MLIILCHLDTGLLSMSKWEGPEKTLAFDLCTTHPVGLQPFQVTSHHRDHEGTNPKYIAY